MKNIGYKTKRTVRAVIDIDKPDYNPNIVVFTWTTLSTDMGHEKSKSIAFTD